MQILRIIFFTALMNMFTSCGQAHSHADAHQEYRKNLAQKPKHEPVLYTRADTHCDAKRAVSNIADKDGNIRVWLSNKGTVELTTVSIPLLVSGFGLKSNLIADTQWGLEVSYDEVCKLTPDGMNCDDTKTHIVHLGKRLYFCKEGGNYPRESLENVALASLVGILKTYKTHLEIYPHSSFKKITLLIHPLMKDRQFQSEEHSESIRLTEERVRTDNAYWRHDVKADTYWIAAIPESLSHKTKRSKIHEFEPSLWEVPSIISHEYAHHIYELYAPSLVDTSGQDWISSSYPVHLSASAINEAFADLIAYYTYQIEFPDWGWFELHDEYENREVTYPRNSDSSHKVLDSLFLNNFFNASENSTYIDRKWKDVDPHVMGSILAHGLFRLFHSRDLHENKTREDTIEAYRRTILWAQALEKNFKALAVLDPRDFVLRVLGEALSVVKNEGPLQEHHCSAMREVFPAFIELYHSCS